MSTSCAHVRMQKHILKCMQCPCTHMYTQTLILIYTCVHTGPDMLAYPDPSAYHCTPTYTQAQNCTRAYRWHPQSCPYICIQDYMQGLECTYMSFAHSVHTVTQAPHCECSATMNSQADPWLPAPSGWLSLPSPSLMTGSSCSCQPQCPPLASRPPGVPRSLINPLTNWPPAP